MFPFLQPLGCPRRHLGDRAGLLHRPGSQCGQALRRRVPEDERAARLPASKRGSLMTGELFLEIGTEEIPAGFIPRAMGEMESFIRKELETAHIGFSEVITMATPRRLILAARE